MYTRAARYGLLSSVRIEGGWIDGVQDGAAIVTHGCTCSGLPPPPPQYAGGPAAADKHIHSQDATARAALAPHGTDPTRPFGYVATETWSYGAVRGTSTRIYCNGDLFECECSHHTITPTRMVLSPYCPDPRFRSFEIQSPEWRLVTVERPGEDQGSFTLAYPDPASAWPEMFCVYRDYFEAGFLPVEERDRATIGAILDEAALALGT